MEEIYEELKSKNTLVLSNTSKKVKIKVDCNYGTVAAVSFYKSGAVTRTECGQEKTIETANVLHGTTIEFNGASHNPAHGQIQIVHTIYEEGGSEITYIFPDDYTGTPEYDETDERPSYTFYIQFV